MINIFYPSKLIDILNKTTKATFIPKLLTDKDKLLIKRKYYSDDFIDTSYFKVIDTFNIDNLQYVQISFSDTTQWCIPSSVGNYHIYELLYDNLNIMNEENIINSKKSYFGYELKYWFFINYRNKFKNFKSIIENEIDDNLRYYINGDYEDYHYKNCKINTVR